MGWSTYRQGLIFYAPDHCYQGYTLFANLRGHHASLIDMEGRICHRWEWPDGINYANLLPGGNLLFLTAAPDVPSPVTGLGGHGGALVELDWDGNKVWEHRNSWLHHDFRRLSNGNTLALLWEPLAAELTARVVGGYTTPDDPAEMMVDVVQEITPEGQVVYEWRAQDHLDLAEDTICPLEGRREWTHGNGIGVTDQGDLLVSFRQTSTVGIVERATGKFSWKWGPGQISHQHNPSFLDSGRVLLFDNGSHRRAPNTSYSRIVEIDPADNQVHWEYRGAPPISFYSYQISGADRLPNGNTLICEGGPGRFLEVTPDKQTVWEYLNPQYAASGALSGGAPGSQGTSVFRAHRYAAGSPQLRGRDLDPARYASLNQQFAED